MSEKTSSESKDQSELEVLSIETLSRPNVIEAYSNWRNYSKAEDVCLEYYSIDNPNVLDLGCGSGRHAHWLNGNFNSYLGIDASSEMIDSAREHFPKLTFEVGDILNFDVEKKYWDVILLMGNVLDFLHPYERRAELLQKCHDWLHPNGYIVGSSHFSYADQKKGYYEEDYHGSTLHQYRSKASEMITELEQASFEVSIFIKDDRKTPADWAYWVVQKSNQT